ncbi:iron complex transport system substrate-binding protein [Pseudomonas cuatrocienegasensis]|uniref:Iron complex transport system substrate-binding protein n=1 Tax=Pseudomonas cuatrocienegasensis TaxID=543360 RepID=A0ABY1BCC0_9PSED|nr:MULTISPECIES: ABC transporter substrate-binding protein [Pseudomonas]OEC35566.1 iron ABC transporter substrate-binding protein [Pseudomonas sp. 21C1]SEQ50024.1 iron complex transport system substrate-binding protein [Pseudomonas cuatrocienegasensis]
MRRLIMAVVLGLAVLTPLQAQVLTDLAGRQVQVPERVERIVLGEGRLLPVLAVLEGEQLLQRLVGMPADLALVDPGSARQYQQAFPALAAVPRIGQGSADSFSLEQVLTLRPDLAIFSLSGHGPGSTQGRMVEQLQRAGVAVLFVDFREQPLLNTPRSMTLLGRALGRQARAEAFNSAHAEALAAVRQRLPQGAGPRVFLHSRAGLGDGCCESMARGMLADLLVEAGGENIARALLPGHAGTLSLELLLSQPPQLYIASAVGSADSLAEGAPYIALGPGVAGEPARASLARLLSRGGLQHLAAVREGRAHAIWHGFYNSPFNVVAVQVFAKWLHPEAFADLDPQQTLAAFYAEFQPVALDGQYWISL